MDTRRTDDWRQGERERKVRREGGEGESEKTRGRRRGGRWGEQRERGGGSEDAGPQGFTV